MSNLVEYAKTELEMAFPDKTDSMQAHAIRNVLELLEVFSNQGHSGMSGSYVLGLFERLVRFKPISPLTGEEDEWDEPWGEENMQQNKRCFSVFRNNFDNSTAENIEGRVFVDADGCCYTSRDSRVPVTFPYEVPEKPEYVKRDPDGR